MALNRQTLVLTLIFPFVIPTFSSLGEEREPIYTILKEALQNGENGAKPRGFLSLISSDKNSAFSSITKGKPKIYLHLVVIKGLNQKQTTVKLTDFEKFKKDNIVRFHTLKILKPGEHNLSRYARTYFKGRRENKKWDDSLVFIVDLDHLPEDMRNRLSSSKDRISCELYRIREEAAGDVVEYGPKHRKGRLIIDYNNIGYANPFKEQARRKWRIILEDPASSDSPYSWDLKFR